MLGKLNYNMEGFYCNLLNMTYSDNPTKSQTEKFWNIVKLVVRVFLRGLIKSILGEDMVYVPSNPHIRVGQYL